MAIRTKIRAKAMTRIKAKAKTMLRTKVRIKAKRAATRGKMSQNQKVMMLKVEQERAVTRPTVQKATTATAVTLVLTAIALTVTVTTNPNPREAVKP
ncbi:hypothetical protein D3C84_905080 [compost metagenome]